MQSGSNISIFYPIVEDAIRRFQLNPQECINPKEEGAWYLSRGPAWVRIFVWTNPETQVPYVRVACPIMTLEEGYQNYELVEHLLRLNADYIGIKFVLAGQDVILGVDRELIGLDSQGMFAMINRVLGTGSEQIPLLKEQFAKDNPKITIREVNPVNA